MKQLIALYLLFCIPNFLSAGEAARLSGTVTDFDGKPLGGVEVLLKNNSFENLARAVSEPDGKFSILAPKGRYFALYAIRPEEYAKFRLEYWAWNLPLFDDLVINPRYDRMEIYGLSAFETKTGPFDTYMIYFRPMSLDKFLKSAGNKSRSEIENKSIAGRDTIDIAPKEIRNEELEVLVNDQKAEILTIQKIVEWARGAFIYGWILQVRKPENGIATQDHDKISVSLHSAETGESGKSDLFIEKK